MAATANEKRQSVVNKKEWLKLVSTQMTENYTSSVTFIKQLTVVAVSMITYLKYAFPEDSYSTETFAGLQLKILNNENCDDELSYLVSTSLQRSFEAFDKQYIRQLALCFYDNSYDLIEYYIFEYSYNPDGVTISSSGRNGLVARHSLESVKSHTNMLIRALSLFLFQHSPAELPANYNISLQIYYNENAPEGYQVPGFRCFDSVDPLEATLRQDVRLGVVETPYHALVARAYTRDAPPLSHEANSSDNAPVMTESEGTVENEEFQSCSSDARVRVRCVCDQTDVGDHILLTCQYCQWQQHAACHGFLRRAPRGHACATCAARHPSRAAALADLLQLEPQRRQFLGLFRRALELCGRRGAVSGERLRKALTLPPAVAALLLRLLAKYHVVPPFDIKNLTVQRKINQAKLSRVIPLFFQDEIESVSDSVVKRLLAESAAAHLADVLSSLEKVTLQNATLGQVITPPMKPDNRVDDGSLQQYRESVMTNQDFYRLCDELLLSGSHNPVKDVGKIRKKKYMKRKNDEDWLPTRSGLRNKKIRATT